MVEDFPASFFPFVTFGAQRSQEWLGCPGLPGLFRMESQVTPYPMTLHEKRNRAKSLLDNPTAAFQQLKRV